MLVNRDGSRLYVASASTDRISVVDTRARRTITELRDPPEGAGQGSTPNALALSADERTLYVAEADNNAVAVFSLGVADSLVARIPDKELEIVSNREMPNISIIQAPRLEDTNCRELDMPLNKAVGSGTMNVRRNRAAQFCFVASHPARTRNRLYVIARRLKP